MSIKNSLRYLDRVLIFMMVLALVLFFSFLILPLVEMVSLPLVFTLERLVSGVKTGYSLIELFSDPRLFRTYSTTEPVIVAQIGATTLVNLIGWNFGVIPNTLIIASFVTLITTLLGLVVAFIMARYDFRGKLIMRVIAYMPLLMTPFVNAYIIKKLFSFDGLFSYIINTVLG
ncbi:MAG: hypothetical protein QXV53_01760, partial [Zestosphaera sp.]